MSLLPNVSPLGETFVLLGETFVLLGEIFVLLVLKRSTPCDRNQFWCYSWFLQILQSDTLATVFQCTRWTAARVTRRRWLFKMKWRVCSFVQIDWRWFQIRGSIYDVHTEGRASDSGGRMVWSAPCGHPHSNLVPNDIFLLSSHTKKLAFFVPEFRLWTE